MEPGPVLVLIQGTDSEQFLGKGGCSHTPDTLKHLPMLGTSKSAPQKHPQSPGYGAGQEGGWPCSWRTVPTAEPCPGARGAASAALTAQHVLLMLGCANQPADSFDALALGLDLLVFCFLGQKHHWKERQTRIQSISATQKSRTKTCLGAYV